MPNHQLNDSRPVLVNCADGVAHLSLNRPDSRNALNQEMRDALKDALLTAEADDRIRAILVTGEGANFCAGADIRQLEARSTLSSSWAPERLDTVVESLSKPVVGALHGYVLGGGMELSLTFTIRLIADNFQGGFPEVKLGVFPALGGTQRLPRLIGEARTLDLMLTGRVFDANEALALGIAAEVVAADQLLERGLALTRKLALGPPVAMRAIVECVRRASDLSLRDGLDYERRLFGIVCGTDDKNEGIRAWLEKRKPTFTGK
ncbi:enoyl-CoA hydratase [Advenella kashmirensis W13003]|uniref:Enoyl-CoA hydratase n=1 Tax=Advenella kashmirensis W13003 TaxID=1424334 RepID=V8QMA5_9BURK|nr:enoyl-CoA hydratase-related protein [Advenella kashmirensis]ETF01081.1 enoyl-CoA hydratase [Advenella kashmirensis W13003]